MGHTCQYLELGRMRDEVACKEEYGISQHPCCGSTLSSLGRARAIRRACVLPECPGGMQDAWAARESWSHSGTDHRAKHMRPTGSVGQHFGDAKARYRCSYKDGHVST